jgi:hypothetical protein
MLELLWEHKNWTLILRLRCDLACNTSHHLSGQATSWFSGKMILFFKSMSSSQIVIIGGLRSLLLNLVRSAAIDCSHSEFWFAHSKFVFDKDKFGHYKQKGRNERRKRKQNEWKE